MATPELTLPASQPPLSAGIPGLDTLLHGGFTPNRMYLVEGRPGTGKTTISMQFLLEGRARGERGLYVALSETTNELLAVGASHGWTLDGIELFQLPTPHNAAVEEPYTLYHPAEVELGDTVRALLEIVDRLRPARIVLDSLSELKLLARDPLRFRRQILALKSYFAGMDTTVLLLDDQACTLVSALCRDDEVVVGWVGDSRAYWIGADDQRQLTTDDSWAAEQVADGLLSEEQAATDPRAHTITRWVGADGPEHPRQIVTHAVTAPGRLVLCSDGLWNYARSPVELSQLLESSPIGQPIAAARTLTDIALARGGHDNVTVAVVEPPPRRFES